METISIEKYTPKQVIPILKEAGASAEDIASVLKSAFDMDAAAAVTALKMLGGFGASAVAGALKSAYSLGGDAIVSALNAIGFPNNVIREAITNCLPDFNLSQYTVDIPHADLF